MHCLRFGLPLAEGICLGPACHQPSCCLLASVLLCSFLLACLRTALHIAQYAHPVHSSLPGLQAEEEKRAAEEAARKKAEEAAAAKKAAEEAAKRKVEEEAAAKKAAEEEKAAAAKRKADEEAAAAAAAATAAAAAKKAEEEAAAAKEAAAQEAPSEAAAPAAASESSFAAKEQQEQAAEGGEGAAEISPFASASMGSMEDGEIAAEGEAEEEQQQEEEEEPEPPTGEALAGWPSFACLLPAVAAHAASVQAGDRSLHMPACHCACCYAAMHARECLQTAEQAATVQASTGCTPPWPLLWPSFRSPLAAILTPPALHPCHIFPGYEDDTSGRKRYGRAFLFFYGNKCTGVWCCWLCKCEPAKTAANRGLRCSAAWRHSMVDGSVKAALHASKHPLAALLIHLIVNLLPERRFATHPAPSHQLPLCNLLLALQHRPRALRPRRSSSCRARTCRPCRRQAAAAPAAAPPALLALTTGGRAAACLLVRAAGWGETRGRPLLPSPWALQPCDSAPTAASRGPHSHALCPAIILDHCRPHARPAWHAR